MTSPKDSPVPKIIVGIIVSQKADLLFLEEAILSKIKNIEINPLQKYRDKNITLIK